ncbi:MAG: hypothetical protein Q4A88_08010 [Clostridia bacterium]|nr:hypothetical protein [Clostridia bacterium]
MMRRRNRLLIICAFLMVSIVFPNPAHADVRFQTIPSEYDAACPEHGAVHSLYYFMSREVSYAANYICLSAGGDLTAVTAMLETMPENTLSFYFVGVGVGDNLFWWRSKNAYDAISPYAEKAEFVEYGYQHDWLTWSNAIYDALTDLLARPCEEEVA